MALSINIPDQSNTSQRISLDGSTYFIRFIFNTRSSSWHYNLADENDTILYDQLSIQPTQNLSSRFRNDSTPVGDFFCLKIENTKELLGRDNFGINKAFRFYYMTQTEITELELEV